MARANANFVTLSLSLLLQLYNIVLSKKLTWKWPFGGALEFAASALLVGAVCVVKVAIAGGTLATLSPIGRLSAHKSSSCRLMLLLVAAFQLLILQEKLKGTFDQGYVRKRDLANILHNFIFVF